MASDAKTTEISTVSLKSMRAPEMFPRGSSGDPQLDDMRSRLQDNFDIITNYFNNVVNNNITNTVNTVNVGAGGLDNTCRVIATTTPVISQGIDLKTAGNETLKLTRNGTLVFCWREQGTAPDWTKFYAVKSVSPYTTWTNLEGTSQTASLVATSNDNNEIHNNPLYCEDSNGNLNFIYNSVDGLGWVEILHRQWTPTATGWINSGISRQVCSGNPTQTAVTYSVARTTLGHCISDSEGGLFFICHTTAAAPNGSWGEVFKYDGNWGCLARYTANAAPTFPPQRRLIDLGNGNLLVLMTMGQFGVVTPDIAYAVLDKLTPVTAIVAGVRKTSIAVDGYMLPTATANVVHSFGSGASMNCSWAAALIAGKNKVSLVYLGGYNASSGNQRAGILYTEYDIATGAWLSQANNIVLSPFNAAGAITPLPRTEGKGIIGSDGIPRILWAHGFSAPGAGSASYPTMVSIAYSRPDSTGLFWQGVKDVYSFSGAATNDTIYHLSDFNFCPDYVTIGGAKYIACSWMRGEAAGSGGLASQAFCFKLLPVTLMDLP